MNNTAVCPLCMEPILAIQNAYLFFKMTRDQAVRDEVSYKLKYDDIDNESDEWRFSCPCRSWDFSEILNFNSYPEAGGPQSAPPPTLPSVSSGD